MVEPTNVVLLIMWFVKQSDLTEEGNRYDKGNSKDSSYNVTVVHGYRHLISDLNH